MRIKRKIVSVFAALTVIAVSLSTQAFAYYIIQYQGINCGGVKDGYIVFQSCQTKQDGQSTMHRVNGIPRQAMRCYIILQRSIIQTFYHKLTAKT